MDVLFAPFEVAFVQRALWGGLLVCGICAIAGTWVVVRGMAFLGDAMSHGMLPGVAVAALLGGDLLLGAACSAALMAVGVTALQRNSRFAADTGIGLVFVGMLAAGVIVVSRSRSFAVDLTGYLFGDVLAIRDRDLVILLAALMIGVVVAVVGHRAFVALTFDPRLAHTLGLRPRWARLALLGLLTLAIVASFHVAGTLLVFGLLIAPPAAALYWADRIPVIMLLAALFGGLSTVGGLIVSWYAGTAAGATIVAVAVGIFLLSAALSWLRERGSPAGVQALVAVLALLLPLAGCGSDTGDPVEHPHGYVAGAEEVDAPRTRLVVADGTAVRVLDLIRGETIYQGSSRAMDVRGDDRYGYLDTGSGVRIVDGGAWTVDHGDHMHYYRTAAKDVGTFDGAGPLAAHSDPAVTAIRTRSGTAILDRAALDSGRIAQRAVIDGLAAPYAEHLAAVDNAGRAQIRDRDGKPVTSFSETCPAARGFAVTRRGLVFGCADGALLVTSSEGHFDAAKINYPEQVSDADRATEFRHRPGATTVVARAGNRGAWVLDIRARTWHLLEIGPIVAANTAGEGAALLALTADGVLHAHDIATGTERTRTPVLAQPIADGPAPVIEIDSGRAYINDPAGRAVHEIDYRDNLRRARTFDLDIAARYLVETGR
ncbi:metal ABC transporter permease [Nocardia panacis]|uniref:Metal ABC transporter permease n=1 Tax=Nocardia panacis TaxID=2340916 RepID=A0A3A4K1X2_9NOCA|nr:zinc ABC transporter permease AztB [Nocardia panacis]RJO73770.1 metal ABC transporter permease [Nocardia panacis]